FRPSPTATGLRSVVRPAVRARRGTQASFTSFLQFRFKSINQRQLARKHKRARFGKAHPARFGDFREALTASTARRPFDFERIRTDRAWVEVTLYGKGFHPLASGLTHRR